MKTILFGLMVLGLAGSVFGADKTKAELDDRIRTLTAQFWEMQEKPDKCVPAETLRKAQGIILLDRTKAGFIFAYQGGGGVALVKDAGGKWSPTAFLAANEASLGFQVGGEQTFFVILLMDTNATRMLTEANFEVGGEARGTAGDQTAAEGKNVSSGPPVLVYTDRQGLYGGATVKGGAISPDNEANRIYYEQPVSMSDILFGKKVTASKWSTDLAARLNLLSEPKKTTSEK